MMPPKRQLPPLTAMRFFLALWVMVYHQTWPDGYLGGLLPRLPGALYGGLRTGYVAVGVFFVLSGFVLSYAHLLGRSPSASLLPGFAVARFARIYPVYCLGLLGVAPFVVRYSITHRSVATVAKQTVLACLSWTLVQSWFPGAALSWNFPAWSLSDEAFFYLCFPFVGLLLWRLSGLRAILIGCTALWAAALAVPAVAVAFPLHGFGDAAATSTLPNVAPLWPGFVKFNPLLRLPEFCVGILLCRAYRELVSQDHYLVGRGYWLYTPGLFCEALAISNAGSLPYPLVHNGLLLPLHSAVILGLALGGGVCTRFLSSPLLVFLGNASYSMYIVHVEVSQWMDAAARRVFGTKLVGAGWFLFYVGVVVFLASVIYRVLEQPSHRYWKAKLTPRLEAWVSKQNEMAQPGPHSRQKSRLFLQLRWAKTIYSRNARAGLRGV